MSLSASEIVTVENAFEALWNGIKSILKDHAYDVYMDLDATVGSSCLPKTNRACSAVAMLLRHEKVTLSEQSTINTKVKTCKTAVWSIVQTHQSGIFDQWEPTPEDEPPSPWPEPEDPDGDARRIIVAGAALARLG